MVEAQAISPNAELTAISWTGGKDCNLALLSAWRNPNLNVTSLVVFRPEGAVFKAHPLNLMEEQSDCLGLPLIHIILPKNPTSYKDAYVSGMRNLRNEYGITVIGTGDMDLVGTMPRNFIEECGEVASVRAYLPLWQADRLECLQTLLAEKFRVIFSCVKSPWFDESWIGRELDAGAVKEMETMSLSALEGRPDVKPLDLGDIHHVVVESI
eukprot:CFRG5588T1